MYQTENISAGFFKDMAGVPYGIDELQAQLDCYPGNNPTDNAVRQSILAEAERLANLGPVGRATERLAPFIHNSVSSTPLLFSDEYSEKFGCEVYFQDETQTSVGSFKLRGSLNAVMALTARERAEGLVTLSAGNAAQGVAKAAQYYGVGVDVFMPETTPEEKVKAVNALGGRVRLIGSDLRETDHAFKQYVDAHPEKAVIHPYDSYEVVVGQGTTGYEVLDKLPYATHFFVPTGGAGLLAGIHLAAQEKQSHVKRIGVEAEHAASFALAHRRRSREALRSVYTKAEGHAVAQIGEVPFGILEDDSEHLVTPHTVSERSLHMATVELNEYLGRPIECTAALGFTALASYAKEVGFARADQVVVFLTGRHRNEVTYQQMKREYESARLTAAV